jgi:glutamyl-tRNA synthetase
VSHVLRGTDLIKEDVIEKFVWNYFKWKKAEFLHYGKLNFPDIKLSKTEARNYIQSGAFHGWEDPRTWSLQSLAKRGIRPEALKEALLDLGMSQSGITFSVDWLYAKNQKYIDEISDRYFYVEDPILLEITGVTFPDYNSKPLLLPSHPEKGKRSIRGTVKNNIMNLYIASADAKKFKSKQVLRLKDLLNVQINSVNLKNKTINAKFHSLELKRDYPIIHWVPEENYINISVLKPDGTLSKGYGEINLLKIPMNKTIQFERYGFVNPIKLENNEMLCFFTH